MIWPFASHVNYEPVMCDLAFCKSSGNFKPVIWFALLLAIWNLWNIYLNLSCYVQPVRHALWGHAVQIFWGYVDQFLWDNAVQFFEDMLYNFCEHGPDLWTGQQQLPWGGGWRAAATLGEEASQLPWGKGLASSSCREESCQQGMSSYISPRSNPVERKGAGALVSFNIA